MKIRKQEQEYKYVTMVITTTGDPITRIGVALSILLFPLHAIEVLLTGKMETLDGRIYDLINWIRRKNE